MVTNVSFLLWRQVRSWTTGDPLTGVPRIMLWAREHPEDLSFVDCTKTGVAFLAETILLDGGRMRVRPRLQPLKVPKSCVVMPVVRLEAGPRVPEAKLVPVIASRIQRLTSNPRIPAVQIDFDALVSQHAFYRRLIELVRRRLPARVKLSITALASWCLYDDWMSGLPVNEAVPLLFRMGRDGPRVLRYLHSGRDFPSGMCRSSVGVSTDEEIPLALRGRRVYVFHPGSWSPKVASDILKKIRPRR